VEITIKEIARQAEMSTSTVSLALRNSDRVTRESKKRVLAIAKKLGYRRNYAAAALRTGKSNTIGIVSSDITQPFSGKMIRAVEQEVSKRNYHFLLFDIRNTGEGDEFYLELYRQRRIDGLLFLVSSNDIDDKGIINLMENDIPVVLTEREVSGADVPCVLIDNFAVAMQATNHLMKCGSKKIVHIAGPDKFFIAEERIRGYLAALKNTGINKSVVTAQGLGLKDGYQAMLHLLENSNERPDAVFAFNDMLAFGAIKAIRDKGLRVPEDIAIVGFDDIPMASFFEPPLTTVHQPVVEMSTVGVEILLNILEGTVPADYSKKTVLEPELIVRKSCGS